MHLHELKIWHAYFRELARGEKRIEVRFGDDRAYAVGDQILFREWEHGPGAYTGRWLLAQVAGVQRVDPVLFGEQGPVVWALLLGEVGAVQEGVAASAVPERLDLGLAPAGVRTFEGWEAWEAWIPVGSIHFVEVPVAGPARNDRQRSVTLHRIPHSAADAALLAWMQMGEHTADRGQLCVLRARRGFVEGPQDQQLYPLIHAQVVRAKRGEAPLFYSEVDVVGVVPEEDVA